MDRRRFLALMGAALASPGLAACETRADTVIVVGAGMAGLSAARAFAARGRPVTLLEARARIGGRIHTSRLWPDFPVDVGASWIHGTSGNPLTGLSHEAGAATLATSYDSARLYVSPALAAVGVTTSGEAWAGRLVDKALARAERTNADMSLRAAVDLVSPPAARSPMQAAQLEHYLAGHYEQEYAGGAGELSAWWTGADKSFGGDDVLFPGGYDQLTDYLSRGLDIRLNSPVSHVRWGGKGVEVELASGERLRGARVVITAPLGVLKAGDIRFTPELPAPKQAAIERLGMGLLNKHFLRFEKAFWPEDIDWHECLRQDPGRWSQWVSFAKAGAPVLLGFSGAAAARQVEALDDRAIVADAASALRDMFGSRTPEPVAAQVTRWSQDARACGAYSFYAVDSSPEDRAELARPEAGGALRFAGEACSADYPGTVHGACLSGRAAAEA